MKDKPIPEWALKAAQNIIRVNHWLVIPNDDTLARAISAYAPDSDLLSECAEVLSYCTPTNYTVYGNDEQARKEREDQREKVERFHRLQASLDAYHPRPAHISTD